MMSNKTPEKVKADVVVSMHYTLKVDGSVVDTSSGADPLEYLQGHGNIIEGLEKEMEGMAVGESKTVSVAAKDGYGEYDAEAVAYIPRAQFPPEIPLEEGIQLQVRDEQGDVTSAWISEVGEDRVQLNFNHPLAGKNLEFEVTVVGLRQPTSEELTHGHVHSDKHSH